MSFHVSCKAGEGVSRFNQNDLCGSAKGQPGQPGYNGWIYDLRPNVAIVWKTYICIFFEVKWTILSRGICHKNQIPHLIRTLNLNNISNSGITINSDFWNFMLWVLDTDGTEPILQKFYDLTKKVTAKMIFRTTKFYNLHLKINKHSCSLMNYLQAPWLNATFLW